MQDGEWGKSETVSGLNKLFVSHPRPPFFLGGGGGGVWSITMFSITQDETFHSEKFECSDNFFHQ
jgi:hypothetical protein